MDGSSRKFPQSFCSGPCWWVKSSGNPAFMPWKRWCALGREEISPSRLRSVTIRWAISRNAWIPARPARPLSIVGRAKRNKAYDDCRWIGLALDGTGAGWRTQLGCSLCCPQRNADREILGYQHSMVLISVVGTGLSLPCDVEPYGPGDSE